MQNYIHHIVGFGGCFSTIVCGRMICTLSAFTCLTEISTPFVSLRWLLSTHKQSSTTLYMVNGLLMTALFFVFRCVLQTYVVFWMLVPAVLERSKEMMAECSQITHAVMWFSLVMYGCLVALNFYWFKMMFTGLLKVVMGKKKESKPESAKKQE